MRKANVDVLPSALNECGLVRSTHAALGRASSRLRGIDATRHKVVTTRPRFEDKKEDFDQLADQWSGVVAKVEAAGVGKVSTSLSECRYWN